MINRLISDSRAVVKKWTLFISLSALFIFAPVAEGQINQEDFVPWPWGAESHFPWASIQGVWSLHISPDVTEYYVLDFEQHREAKVLRLRKLDLFSCQVSHIGYAREFSDRVVRGLIYPSYEPFELRVFQGHLLPKEYATRLYQGYQLVLSQWKVRNGLIQLVHLPLIFQSATPPYWCHNIAMRNPSLFSINSLQERQ